MSLENKIHVVQEKIQQAYLQAGRKGQPVKLLAVSKKFPAGYIRKAFEFGLQSFAENYVQEALQKQEELKNYKIDWHFIGHLQTNKVKLVANRFSLIHSIDSLRLIDELEKKCSVPQHILLEVNLLGEKSKSGCAPTELPSLIAYVQTKKNIILSGLMFMAPLELSVAEQEQFYERAFQLREKMATEVHGPHSLVELSMGTSHDFEVAIRHGATIVRLGSTLFGERSN